MESSVTPTAKGSPYFGIDNTVRTVKVVSTIDISDLELLVSDTKGRDDALAGNPVR
jgi:hypothetical protein